VSMRYQVRRLYPGKRCPWAVTAKGWGTQPHATWQAAMDTANERARREREARRDMDIAYANGWPQLAGLRLW
jgi:hypothetical protein